MVKLHMAKKEWQWVCNIVSRYVATSNYYMSVYLTGTDYENHVLQMAPIVVELATLESKAQVAFLRTHIAER